MPLPNRLPLGSTSLDNNLFICAYDNRKTDRAAILSRRRSSGQSATNELLALSLTTTVHKHLNGPINHAAPLLLAAALLCSLPPGDVTQQSSPISGVLYQPARAAGRGESWRGGRRRKRRLAAARNRGGLVIIYSKGVSPISQCFRCSSPTMEQR